MKPVQADRNMEAIEASQTVLIHTLGEFEKIWEPWEELRSVCNGSPFLSFAWICNWWRAFGDGHQLLIALQWDQDRIICAIPLYFCKKPVGRLLPLEIRKGLLLSNHRTGFTGCLIHPEFPTSFASLWRNVKKDMPASSFEFEPCIDDAGLDPLISGLRQENGTVEKLKTMKSCYLDLENGWDDYLSSQKRSFRKNLSVCKRRVEDAGCLVLSLEDKDPDFVNQVLSVSETSWKATSGTGLSASSDLRQFTRGLLVDYLSTNMVKAWVLKKGDLSIASFIAIEDNGVSYAFQIEFSESASDLSPGRFLMAHWLQNCFDRKMNRADFLRDTPIIRTFSQDTYDLVRLDVYSKRKFLWIWSRFERLLVSILRRFRPYDRSSKKRGAFIAKEDQDG